MPFVNAPRGDGCDGAARSQGKTRAGIPGYAGASALRAVTSQDPVPCPHLTISPP